MPYAPLRRRRRPLREYSFPPILHKNPWFPCRQRRHKKWRRRRRTSPAQRYYIPPEGEALNPSGRRQPVPDRTLAAQGRQARRLPQPSPAGRQPSGIPESTAQVPIPTAPKAPEPSNFKSLTSAHPPGTAGRSTRRFYRFPFPEILPSSAPLPNGPY